MIIAMQNRTKIPAANSLCCFCAISVSKTDNSPQASARGTSSKSPFSVTRCEKKILFVPAFLTPFRERTFGVPTQELADHIRCLVA